MFRVLKNSDGTPDGLLLEEINPMFTVDDIKKQPDVILKSVKTG